MKKLILFVALFALAGCQQGGPSAIETSGAAALRPVSQSEGAADFDQLLEAFKTYYGPYAYKEARLGISIADTLNALKLKAAAAKTDEEFIGDVMAFGASLKDGHVQISVENSASGIASYLIPLVVTPVEHRAMVGDIDKDLATYSGIAIGDEVLEVDGKPTMSYLPSIVKYKSWARDSSNEHLIYKLFSRSSYMTDIVPVSSVVRIKVQKPDGDVMIVDVPWTVVKYSPDADRIPKLNLGPLDMRVDVDDLNSINGNIKQMGAVNPFFLTPQTQAKYGFVQVYPSDTVRKQFGLADAEKPPIYAALYRAQGKTVLLVRIATYSPSDFSSDVYMKAYQALMSQYHDLADVLVLDQTHNPGGSYCADFYDLFAKPGDVQSVELLHADRKWINDLKVNWIAEAPALKGSWDAAAMVAASQDVERAYDAGQALSAPMPLFQGSFYTKKRQFAWNDKPALILIDELAGSCGDMFPMLVKANAHYKMFGQATMGLGGNVEEVTLLDNSRIHVKLTRGMFYAYNPNRAPLAAEFVENNGVDPDISYTHTVHDFRAGFVGYVDAFTTAALQQTAP